MGPPARLRAPLALLALCALGAAAPAAVRAADDPAERLYARTCLPPVYVLRREETDHQAHMRCSGRGESFCLELRSAYVGKRLPRLAAADVRSACGGEGSRGAARWLELRDAVSALVRGHSYTPAERAEVERTIRSLSLIYQRPGGPSRAELDALRQYYLNKAFVLSAEQDREHQETARRLLAALEQRTAKAAAGTLSAEELGEWARFVEFVEAYIITPGSGLARREEFLRKFDEVAAYYDLHEYLTRRATEGLAARREEYFRDGRLTEAGAAAARELARARLKLRAVAHLDIADGMTRAPDSEREDWREQSERANAEAQRTAEALRDDERLRLLGEFERSDFVQRRSDAAPPAPHRRMDPASFPDEFPQYFVRAAPDRAALIYRFSESYYARMGTTRPPDMIGFSGRVKAAERELYHYLVSMECPGPGSERAACDQAQRARAERMVQGSDPFQRGLTEVSALASERRRREELWDGVKHFIPGYDCYALVAERDRTTAGEQALQGGMCVLGVLPLARATARLGQTALSRATLGTAGTDAVGAIPRSPGSVLRVEEEALRRNAALATAAEREAAALAQIPGLTREQARAVVRAHNEVPCAIGACTAEQLRRKVEILREAGLDVSQTRAAIERGLAGERRVVVDGRVLPASEVAQLDFRHAYALGRLTDDAERYISFRLAGGERVSARVVRQDGRHVHVDFPDGSTHQLTAAELETARRSHTARDHFANVPVRGPPSFEIGSQTGPHGHVIAGGVSTGRSSTREIIKVDWGDPRLASFYDDILRDAGVADRAGRLSGAEKGGLLERVFLAVKRRVQPDEACAAALASTYANREMSIGEILHRGGGVCRHMGILNAAVLEKLLKENFLSGRVYYVRGKAHGWAVYETRSGERFVLDAMQQNTLVRPNATYYNGTGHSTYASAHH